MMIDAHMHIRKSEAKDLLWVMRRAGILGLACGTEPQECRYIKHLSEISGNLIPSYGLHPWKADCFEVEELLLYMKSDRCPIIGEIGLDSVWCKVDLTRQKEVFYKQLVIADELGKPVLLHIKGQEKEAAEILKQFSLPVIVHWYSSMEDLKLYLEMDSYFTVGPDVRRSEAVQNVVRKVPLHRLLAESDGLSAVEWATGKICTAESLPGIMQDTMAYIASEKMVSLEEVALQMENTFRQLVTH